MIITKEQQEKALQKYIDDKHTTEECIGFIDGLNAMIDLINNRNPTREEIKNHSSINSRVNIDNY